MTGTLMIDGAEFVPNYALYKSPSASWGELSSALRDRLALISAERGGE